MILLTDILVSIAIAFFFTAIIAVVFGRPATMGTYGLLFILLMLAILAGGNWIVPIGIPVQGYYWSSFFLVGLIVSLLFLALLPRLQTPRNLTEGQRQKRSKAEAVLVFDFFFGLIVIILAAVIVASYI
jgi:hypothetical protein